MADETPICVTGNLTADPELRFTPNGAAVANLKIADTPRVFDRQANEFRDGETNFWECSGWRKLGENIAESLRKGQRVVAYGVVKTQSWEDKETGQKRSKKVLELSDIGPSLKYSTATATKNERQGGGQQPQAGGDPSWGGNAGGWGDQGTGGDGWGSPAPATTNQDPWK